MVNPILVKPAILAVVVAISSAVAFAAGYLVSNWRDGAQIERLSGQNKMLETVSGKCETDVKNIRGAMQAIQAEAEERVRQAEEAMNKIDPQVKERTVTITKIKTLPPVPMDQQCEAIKEEQTEYVAWRRGV